MSLLDDVKERFVLMDRQRTDDGLGGYIQAWVEGVRFDGYLSLTTTAEVTLAQQQGASPIYSLLAPKSLPISYQDVVKGEDGSYYRVTSAPQDKQAPKSSSLDLQFFTAEKLKGLPT